MQESFPKIDLREKDDAAYYFDQIRRHASKLVQKELERDKLGMDKEAISICNRAIDEWISSSQKRMEPNMTVNGLPYSKEDLQSETFNVKLSEEVQKLTQEADKLTEEVIKARKSVPSRKAAALQARFEVMNERREREESRRRKAEGDHEELMKEVAKRPQVTLERADQVGETLEVAVNQIENLAVTLLERSSAAQEQAKFVKRLRIMNASYE